MAFSNFQGVEAKINYLKCFPSFFFILFNFRSIRKAKGGKIECQPRCYYNHHQLASSPRAASSCSRLKFLVSLTTNYGGGGSIGSSEMEIDRKSKAAHKLNRHSKFSNNNHLTCQRLSVNIHAPTIVYCWRMVEWLIRGPCYNRDNVSAFELALLVYWQTLSSLSLSLSGCYYSTLSVCLSVFLSISLPG